MEKKGIQIVAVAGSVRPRNFTSKALGLVLDEVKRREDVTLDAIDLASIELPPPGNTGSYSVKRLEVPLVVVERCLDKGVDKELVDLLDVLLDQTYPT